MSISARRSGRGSARSTKSNRSVNSARSTRSTQSTGSARRTNERHNRLRKLLFQKLSELHQRKSGRKLSVQDKKFVEPFIEELIRSGNSSETGLKKVEFELRKHKRAKSASTKKTTFSNDDRKNVERKSRRPNQSKKKEEKPQPVIMEDLWAALYEKDRVQYNKAMVKNLEKKRKMKKEQRDFLHKQIADKQYQRTAEVGEREKWAKHSYEQQELWKKEQHEKKLVRRNQILEEKKIRQKQLLEREMRQREIEDSRRKEDMQHLNNIRQDLISERNEEIRLKEENRKKYEQTKKFNELERIKREEERKKMIAEDIQLQKERIRILEKQARDREENFKKIYSRQKRYQTNYMMSTGKSLDEKAKEDELRALHEQKLENERIETQYQERTEKLRKDKENLRNHLNQQIELKRNQIREEQAELRREREKLQNEFNQARRMEIKKKNQIKNRDLEYKDILSKQVVEQAERKRTKFFMSEHEKRMNSRLLRQLLD